MIYDIDELINAEILFEQQYTGDESSKEFKALLLAIIASIKAGEPLKKTKKIIDESDINKDLKDNLEVMINEQLENITGEKQKFDFATALIAGYTFNELLAQRKVTTKKQLTKFMVSAIDVIKQGGAGEATLVSNEVNRYEKGLDAFYRTQTKGAREHGYAENDKKLRSNIKGWMSIAVLDNKTSVICLSLHNKFYSIEDYKTRFDIPYQIPRHPHCRSMFVTVFKDKSIQSYKGKNLETFLMQNPTQGKELMGIKKYELFTQEKIKLTNFVDLKNGRYFTNAEIKKRLKIK
jgi:hypothetical protein